MKRKIIRLFSAAVLLLFIYPLTGCGAYKGFDPASRVEDTRNLSAFDYSIDNLTGQGDFPNHEFGPSDGPKTDKQRYEGMFYFTTMFDLPGGIYDVSQILDAGGRANFDGDFPWSPVNAVHFWGQPVWDYYTSSDPYVLRKQVEMLTMAGVDFIYFDASK